MWRFVLLITGVLMWPSALADTVLENAFWRVEVDAATLAIRVTPALGAPVQASTGARARKVEQLKLSENRIDWQWDEGAWVLSAVLEQRDLILTIAAREPGELSFLRQPGTAMGNGLIWPLAEGHYVPAGNAQWRTFLLKQGEFNTTQDLSLPLWGVDHGNFTLNWLMTNPYNNRLTFNADGRGIALTASHEFTALDPTAAMTFRLTLGEADLLSGAKRYRQWLLDTGHYETLSAKLVMTPEGKKLLGAAHIYLWGGGLLGPADVRDWPTLMAVLNGQSSIAKQLRGYLGEESRNVLKGAGRALNPYQQRSVLRALNAALNRAARQSWQTVSEPDMHVLAKRYGELRGEFAQVFAAALVPHPERWGDAVSLNMIERLQQAKLPRLWLGVGEAWEAGLWHPEAVRAGVAAGYLVAPYDSYETALSPTDNPDWTTAHLGSNAYRTCGIVLKDGEMRSGFLNSGYYTDPRCIRPLLESRIKAIQAAAGFNSWFLDVTAAGMLFDSYRPGASMTQAQNAAENIAAGRWINETLNLPMGSEDGNAVTAQGILFAHGMQTPVFGWGDEAMSKDPRSPYFLGAWYPPEQPDVFFKPVPVKEPYRGLYFDPVMRLPLYQAVFHGSVITSHHWTFDRLKLSNVHVENELAQLLYNVAPLYHLSAATLEQRLPVIQRQDAFFRPLHERLATQALTDFSWLTKDRKVQQTTFADSTRLVANFDARERHVQGQWLAAHSITAFMPEGGVVSYQVESPH